MNVQEVPDERSESQGLSMEEISAIDAAVEKLRDESHVPGCALAIVWEDRTIYERGYGLRDLDAKLPVNVDTLFPIGSCSKSFTAMVLQMSQDDGLLTLDDHPRKYLPYFSLKDPEADAGV